MLVEKIHGEREKKEKLTRKMRNPHALQIKLSKSNKFGQDKGEELRQGSWSTFKSIVMQEILCTFSYTRSCYDASKVTTTYNDIHYYSSAPFSLMKLPPYVVFNNKFGSRRGGRKPGIHG